MKLFSQGAEEANKRICLRQTVGVFCSIPRACSWVGAEEFSARDGLEATQAASGTAVLQQAEKKNQEVQKQASYHLQ